MAGFSHKYTRRCFGHDYKSRCIYLITILKSPEAPPFSSIAPDPGSKKLKPFVTLTPLGKIIAECINRLCLDFPDVKVLCYIIMPDHVHIELFVTRQMDIPLGSIIAPFKSACTRLYWERFPQSTLALGNKSIFLAGFNDKIAHRAGAKDAFFNYILDNPRRYLVKKLFPEYFYHKLVIKIEDKSYGLYGNIFLLDHPIKSYVKISRVKSNTRDLAAKEREWRETIRSGGVLVSPFINPHERKYRDMAIHAQTGIIQIVDYRFSDRSKPYKELFDLCVEGRLLIISTEEYAAPNRGMNHDHAMELNAIAEQISQLAPGAAQFHPKEN